MGQIMQGAGVTSYRELKNMANGEDIYCENVLKTNLRMIN